MTFFREWPVSSICFMYFLIRAWSFGVSRSMLNVILRSSMGKRSPSYAKNAAPIQRIYGTYIPLVTRYRHRLSKYLAGNHVVSAIFSGMLLLLSAAVQIGLDKAILDLFAMIALLLLCVPPIMLSFIQTSYEGGHPRYRFDLEADFISKRACDRKRALLEEKKSSTILTPEEFLASRQRD